MPLRILHVISGLNPAAGGTTTALCGLVDAQRRAGLDVRVATHFDRETDHYVIRQLRDDGVMIHTIEASPRHADGRRLVASQMPTLVTDGDVVHIHAVWEPIQHIAARASHDARVPYLISPHGMLDPYNLRRKFLKKFLYRKWRLQKNLDRAAAVHCTTRAEADLAGPLLRKTNVLVESLGVDLKQFESLPPEGTFRATCPEAGHRPIVLFLSRLHEKKGLDILLTGFAEAKRGNALLVIAGPDAGYLATARELVRTLHLQKDVLFTGMLHGTDRINALVDAQVMVLPSYQENFGIVVIESLACGTPVIISDQVNLHSEIAPANVGAIIPASREALVVALNHWLTDHAMRQAAAERARPFVRETYDWTEIGRRWVGHYHGIVSPNHRPTTT